MAQAIRQARRRWLLIAIGVVVFLGVVLSSASGFYVDLLWFREVQFDSVFWSVYWSKVVLGVIFGALFFGSLATVVALPPEPQEIPTGARVRVLEADLHTGERVIVPRANVEIIES